MDTAQHVCLVCGYNMIGYHPQNCPFCGADPSHFITADQCSASYRVEVSPVSRRVKSLKTAPRLGYEHAGYRIDTGDIVYWIDCPSCFDALAPPADVIMFTHPHFLGATNLYRDSFSCRVRINIDDSDHDLCRGFPFDELFQGDFEEDGIEAHHLNGHTRGFTAYVYESTLFVCDYFLMKDGALHLNPYGPEADTVSGAGALAEILSGRSIQTVCGYDYVSDYPEWKHRLDVLLEGI